jgi:putative flippase GtrA
LFSVDSWPQPAARAWVVARRFQKFLVVGFVGLGVNQGMLFLLHQGFGSHLIISSTIAIFTSMIVTFLLNEHWTWHDRAGGPLMHRIVKYFPINLVGLVINVVVLRALVNEADMHYLVANLFGAGAAAIWNFFLNNQFTWGANEESSRRDTTYWACTGSLRVVYPYKLLRENAARRSHMPSEALWTV